MLAASLLVLHFLPLRERPDCMEILVELDNVSKSYEEKAAVRDLSLKIEAGSMFGLLGPNGAGSRLEAIPPHVKSA